MIRAIEHNFHITFDPPRLAYEFGREKTETVVPNPSIIRAPTPIIALDRFHKTMQRELGISHRYYHVKKLEKVYNDGADNKGREIRSSFDLPDSRTPDVTKKKRTKAETMTMPFYDDMMGRAEPTANAFDTK